LFRPLLQIKFGKIEIIGAVTKGAMWAHPPPLGSIKSMVFNGV